MNIHERVMRAMTRPSQNHRDPWFNPWFASILEESKSIFKTKEGTTFIFPGTGTGGDGFACGPNSGSWHPLAVDGHQTTVAIFLVAHRRLGVGFDEHAKPRRQNRDLPLRTILTLVGESFWLLPAHTRLFCCELRGTPPFFSC